MWLFPWKGDIVFALSVCPGRCFFLFRARDYSVFITHKQEPVPSKSWVSGVCNGGWFSVPTNISPKKGLWKRSKITNFNSWSVTSQTVLGPGMQYSYHIKPCSRSLTAFTQFVRTSKNFVTNDFWNCLRRRLPGKLFAKTSQVLGFLLLFSLKERNCKGTWNPGHSGP